MAKARLNIVLIIMSTAIILSLGSFFLPRYITYIIDEDRANSIELNYARELKLPAYYRYLKRSSNTGSATWVRAAEFLSKNNPVLSVELAEYYWSVKDLNKAKFWLIQATKKNMTAANYRLAQLYSAEKDYQKAYQLLFESEVKLAGDTPKEILTLAIELAVWTGDKSSTQQLSLLFDNNDPTIVELYEYNVLPTDNKKLTDINCMIGLEMFATNLADLRRVERFKGQIQERKLSQFVCISTIRYIPLKELQCTHAKDSKIECNEAIWQQYANDINSRFIGVVVPEGGANVHNGIMYMDSRDTVDVFVHEMAHLLGFIDEYPLPMNHAKCLSEQQAALSHNIAVLTPIKKGKRATLRKHILEQLSWGNMIKSDTPIMEKTESGWRLGTPKKFAQEVGLFPSQTCDGSRTLGSGEAVSAYKPVSQLTKMNYFELEFPSVYLEIISNYPNKFLMPSFHVNIANAIENFK